MINIDLITNPIILVNMLEKSVSRKFPRSKPLPYDQVVIFHGANKDFNVSFIEKKSEPKSK